MMRTGIIAEFDTTGEGEHFIEDRGFLIEKPESVEYRESYRAHYSLFELLEEAERVVRERRILFDCDEVYIRRMPYREDEKVTYRFYIA